MIDRLRQIVAGCTLCSLHEGRVNPVFDKGNYKSNLMICGMVPAHDENMSGTPFVGAAGKLLDIILDEVDLTYNDVYITNLVKCFVAAGTPLKKKWVDSCRPYLVEQIRIIKPSVIVTLGADSSLSLTELPKMPIGRIRGRILPYNYRLGTIIVPTYHPSYLLRQGGKGCEDYYKVIDDFELAKKCLKEWNNV